MSEISESRRAVMSADGDGEWVALRRGWNVVEVTAGTWAAATRVALQQSPDATDAKMSTVKIDGTAVELAANDRVMIRGPGYARGVVSDYVGSTAITLERTDPE